MQVTAGTTTPIVSACLKGKPSVFELWGRKCQKQLTIWGLPTPQAECQDTLTAAVDPLW